MPWLIYEEDDTMFPEEEKNERSPDREDGRRLRAPRKRHLFAALLSTVLLLFGSATLGAASSAPVAATPQSPAAQGETLAGFHQGSVPVNGGTLHYVRGGSGPVLVLLHGWPETWWSFHDVMPALAEHYTVVAFDLPGLGQSSVPKSGYDAEDTASRIRQGVHDLGYDKVDLVGFDMGVLVAYDYARDHPSEVTKLAVLESALNGFGLENAYSLSFHFRLNMAPAPVPENIVNNREAEQAYLGYIISSFSYGNGAIADENAYFRAYANPANREAGYDYYRAWPQNAANNLANAGKRLEMPVLAMGGQYAFGAGVAASFDQVADHVQQVIAPDSGHFIPEEVPGFLTSCFELYFGGAPSGAVPADLASCVSP
ncbi:MAG TPA: alpha/beta hydrolase [Actinocrinis sp.]|nr:alpha/beta hydrolase [Actinocrinis sp.]